MNKLVEKCLDTSPSPDLVLKYSGSVIDLAFGKVEFESGAEQKVKDWVKKIREDQLEYAIPVIKKELETDHEIDKQMMSEEFAGKLQEAREEIKRELEKLYPYSLVESNPLTWEDYWRNLHKKA